MIDIKNDAYDIASKVLHKNFIIKNPWGKIGGKLIELFTDVLKRLDKINENDNLDNATYLNKFTNFLITCNIGKKYIKFIIFI